MIKAKLDPKLRSLKWSHWLLRLPLIGIFAYHGIEKLIAPHILSQGAGISITLVILLAVIEAGGALLMLIGGLGSSFATRLAGGMFCIVMAGAIMFVHWGQWSFIPSATHPIGGIEFQVYLFCTSLYFVITGNTLDSVNQVP